MQGEFAGYVVEQAHTWQDKDNETMVTWDDYESVWGFESDTYAREQAAESLPADAVKPIDAADLADEYTPKTDLPGAGSRADSRRPYPEGITRHVRVARRIAAAPVSATTRRHRRCRRIPR